MPNDIHRLVYYSRNRISSSAEMHSEISSILNASRRNNLASGITGALMFNAGCFGQVLEGSRADVEAVFERIQQDERHGDVSLLSFASVDERAFPNWSMAFVGGSDLDASDFAHIQRDSGYDPARMSADELFEALHRLTIEEEFLHKGERRSRET